MHRKSKRKRWMKKAVQSWLIVIREERENTQKIIRWNLHAFANLFLLIFTWNMANATCSPFTATAIQQFHRHSMFQCENTEYTIERKAGNHRFLCRNSNLDTLIWKQIMYTPPKILNYSKIERRTRRRDEEWQKKVKKREEKERSDSTKAAQSQIYWLQKQCSIETKFCRKLIKWYSNGVHVCVYAPYIAKKIALNQI